jgi:hypothetical protein
MGKINTVKVTKGDSTVIVNECDCDGWIKAGWKKLGSKAETPKTVELPKTPTASSPSSTAKTGGDK